ncbi:MAG: LysE family translocator [Alphaproteobacteria bacterium]
MPIETWFAFMIASAIIISIPGPTVMMVISYAINKGKAAAFASISGVILGDFTAVTLSLAGVGAILATSSLLFNILKFAGAAYLLYLGIKLWLDNPKNLKQATLKKQENNKRIFTNVYLVTTLNPKCILFFIAFVPQFMTPDLPIMPQMTIITLSFVVLGGLNATFWAIGIGKMAEKIMSPTRLKILNRIGGSFMITAGILTALGRKA